MPNRLPRLSELPTAIPLPGDARDLTPELVARIFSPAAIDDFVRSIRLAAPVAQHTQHTTPHAAVLERHANGR